MGKRIVRNADLLKKAQDLKYIVKEQDAPEQITPTPEPTTPTTEPTTPTTEPTTPTTEPTTPTPEQIEDICPYAPTCHDDWNNKEWNDVCTESDYQDFIEIIQPFCIKNPDFMGCDDCLL